MQHLWLTERIIDIVAPSSTSIRSRSGSGTTSSRADAVRDAERLRLRLGRLLGCLDIALDLIGYDTIEERQGGGGARGKLLGIGIGSTLDSGTNNFGQSRSSTPSSVLGEQRGGDREARHLRRGRRDARDGAAGPGARDHGLPGRRGHPRLLARPGERALRPRHVVQLARGLLGHLREPVRVHRARRREGRGRTGARGDDQARRRRAPGAEEAIELAEGFARIKDGPPEAALPFMALGAIVNANNAFLPPDFNPTLNHRYVCRPYFGMVDTEKKTGQLTLTYATQIHAAVVEIDPETGEVESSITRPWTTAACGSIRRSSRDRCTARLRTRSGGAPRGLRLRRGGKLLTANFYDYHVPHALDMPPLKTGAIESPSPFSPLGAKGMGEGGGGGIHCIGSAIQDASGLRAADRLRQLQPSAQGVGDAPGPGSDARERLGGVEVKVSGTKELAALARDVWRSSTSRPRWRSSCPASRASRSRTTSTGRRR